MTQHNIGQHNVVTCFQLQQIETYTIILLTTIVKYITFFFHSPYSPILSTLLPIPFPSHPLSLHIPSPPIPLHFAFPSPPLLLPFSFPSSSLLLPFFFPSPFLPLSFPFPFPSPSPLLWPLISFPPGGRKWNYIHPWIKVLRLPVVNLCMEGHLKLHLQYI